MIDFDFNEYCCGCSSCANACPTHAIKMVANEGGFLMPVISTDSCVKCGKCDNVCPYINLQKEVTSISRHDFDDKKTFLYYSKSKERENSASGGFVYDVYKNYIDNGGYAAGCVWDKDIVARHIVSNDDNDIARMQSSKYVQSDTARSYADVRELLKKGQKVVFCGTPCQTAGLHYFLGKTDRSNLVSICCICHGVPSPGVWDCYKKTLERQYGGVLIGVNMRDKSYKGYSTSYARYTFDCNDEAARTPQTARNVGLPTYLADPYIFLFTDDLYLRNCCYHCPYKGTNNKADIIVGDFYASIPQAGNLGCSSVIVMTEKGENLIKELDGGCVEGDNSVVVGANSMLWKSVSINKKRKDFFEDYKAGKSNLFTKYLPVRFRIKRFLNNIGIFNAYLTTKRIITNFINRSK